MEGFSWLVGFWFSRKVRAGFYFGFNEAPHESDETPGSVKVAPEKPPAHAGGGAGHPGGSFKLDAGEVGSHEGGESPTGRILAPHSVWVFQLS
jgi:hypothetical protein